MAEFTGGTTLEFETDIEIDFSEYPPHMRLEIIKAIVNGDKYNFSDIYVSYEGEVTIDVEPDTYP